MGLLTLAAMLYIHLANCQFHPPNIKYTPQSKPWFSIGYGFFSFPKLAVFDIGREGILKKNAAL